jgi:hypothetical protein
VNQAGESAVRNPSGWLAKAVVAGAIALGACAPVGASPTASSLDSGVRGTVLIGPTCPVEIAGQSPCVKPYPGVLIVTDSDGKEVARTTAAADGTFSISLPPADYVILPQPGNPFPQAQPIDVTVVPGQFEDVQVNYDSGIR